MPGIERQSGVSNDRKLPSEKSSRSRKAGEASMLTEEAELVVRADDATIRSSIWSKSGG